MVVTFGAYDFLVHRRNRKIVDAAAKFNSIVSSLFPENVRERLFADAEEKMRKKETIQAFKGIDDFIASEGSFDGDHETANDGGRPVRGSVCRGLRHHLLAYISIAKFRSPTCSPRRRFCSPSKYDATSNIQYEIRF